MTINSSAQCYLPTFAYGCILMVHADAVKEVPQGVDDAPR